MRRYGAAVLTVALAAGFIAGTAPALAAPARCGTVVEDRLVLDHDLRCDGPALVLRNPLTVVQLNGHTLESSRDCGKGASSGIVVESSAEGAQILGPGLMRRFAAGIEISGSARVQVRDVRLSDSCAYGLVIVGPGRRQESTRAIRRER